MILVKGSSSGAPAAAAADTGGHRERQHLGYRPRVNSKTSRRFPLAHTFNLNRKTNPSVQLHALHPPAPAAFRQGHLLPDFYFGATGLPGRFSEGFFSSDFIAPCTMRIAGSRACKSCPKLLPHKDALVYGRSATPGFL